MRGYLGRCISRVVSLEEDPINSCPKASDRRSKLPSMAGEDSRCQGDKVELSGFSSCPPMLLDLPLCVPKASGSLTGFGDGCDVMNLQRPAWTHSLHAVTSSLRLSPQPFQVVVAGILHTFCHPKPPPYQAGADALLERHRRSGAPRRGVWPGENLPEAIPGSEVRGH